MALDLPKKTQEQINVILAEVHKTHDVLAFGSRVNGTAHAGSDLDIALRNKERPEEPLLSLAKIRAAFRDSDIPILIDLHDWAALPKEFRAEIVKKTEAL
jgi:predicted nucleotidyltransferase